MLLIKRNPRRVAMSLALVVVLVVTCARSSVWGQVQVGAGRGLDANRRVGSSGRNPAVRRYSSLGNQIVSGSVGGGKSFKGLGGTRDIRDFQGSLGSSTLSSFTRDSYSLSRNASTLGAAQPFYLPSRTVLGVRGITSGLAQPGGSAPRSVNLTPPALSGPSRSRTPTGALPKISSLAPVDLRTDLQPPPQRLSEMPQPIVETASNLFGIRRPSTGYNLSESKFGVGGEIFPSRTVELSRVGPDKREPFQALPEWAKPVVPDSTKLEEMSQPGGLEQTLPTRPGQEQLDKNLQEAKKLIDQSTASLGVPSMVDIYEQMLAESKAEEQMRPSDAGAVTGIISPIVPSVEEDEETARLKLLDKLRSYNTFVGGRRSSYNDYMAQGESLLKQGQYYQAALFYERASEMRPKNPLAYLGRAYSLCGAGDLLSASDSLMQALEIFPEQAQRKIDLPKFFHSQAELDRITNKLARLVEANEQNVRVRLLLGYFYHYSGQSNLAAGVLHEAAQLAKADTKVSADSARAIEKFAQNVSRQAEKSQSR